MDKAWTLQIYFPLERDTEASGFDESQEWHIPFVAVAEGIWRLRY
jgi:hypothetical protein